MRCRGGRAQGMLWGDSGGVEPRDGGQHWTGHWRELLTPSSHSCPKPSSIPQAIPQPPGPELSLAHSRCPISAL